jgi:predicted dehydrogenase
VAVGLVGCGNWGRHILRDLVSLGCRVSVVARSAESRARAVEGGAAEVVGTPDALGPVDGLVVATPTSTHADVLDKVLDRNVPVFVEKPMTDDPHRAAELARRAPGRLFVMDKWRHHPAVRALREIARDGVLGAPTGLVTRREQWGSPHPDVDPVWILAPHDLVSALEILGELPAPRSASLERRSGAVVGLQATLDARGGAWMQMSLSAAAPAGHRSMRLLLQDGTAWFTHGWADHVTVAPSGRSPERRDAPGELPLLAELRAFAGHLRGGPPPVSDAATGAAVVELIAELRALAR